MIRRILAFGIAAVVTTAATPAVAGVDLNLTGGIDVSGSFDLGDISSSADPGFTLGLELMFEVPVVELGVGFEYGFGRDTGVAGADAEYWHLYGVGRLFVFGRLYLVARAGYYDLSTDDVLEGEIGNDVTIGGGAGLGILKNLKVEVLFNDLTSSLDYEAWLARAVFTF
jgi:hypothetical protein